GDDLIGADELAVDAYTLAEGVQIWLCIQADAQSSGLEDGGNQRGGGAFALGAGDMGTAIGPLWVAERGQERPLASQVVLAVADEVAGALGVAEAIEPGQRLRVGGDRCLAHAVSPCQPRTTASAILATRVICLTSWTRTMSAPPAIARATVAAVPSTRSSTGVPRTRPMCDLREVPTSRGRAKARSSPSRASTRRFSSPARPKPKPGSRMRCSKGMPAAMASSILPASARVTSATGS